MTTFRILQSLTIAAALVAAVGGSHCDAAECDACDTPACDSQDTATTCRCPLARICSRCREKVCVTIASPGKETKSCWEVECDEVCIPAVRFPWDCCGRSGCDECHGRVLPRCGKVRRVRKLKPVEYECDGCEYDHKIVDKCDSCGPTGAGECVPPPASASTVQEPPAVSETAVNAGQKAAPEQGDATPHWSDRFQARVLSVKEKLTQQPETVDGDLSRYIGHSIATEADNRPEQTDQR